VKCVGTRIGNYILDLRAVYKLGVFSDIKSEHIFFNNYLNDFITLGRKITNNVRLTIQKELCDQNSVLKKGFDNLFYPIDSVKMHLPLIIGDYTDFYSSKYHAENVGRIFRGEAEALAPNWKHMPIAYHGRSSSIVISGTEIKRPSGQFIINDKPIFGSSEKVDFELEIATVIGKENKLGSSISINDANDYIFGFCLLNDWSARDIQSWEYRPLGPFLGKNFATTISPWIITVEALEQFKTAGQDQSRTLNYLSDNQHQSFDINLSVFVNNTELVNTNFKNLYWTPQQQIAHHTVNGCNLRVGDLLGSGTISGPEEKGKGCLLEATYGGEKAINLNKEQIFFLRNDDKVELRGYCKKNGIRVGFGKASGKLKN